jgi:hypothetical protein
MMRARLNGHEATLHQAAREAEAGATFRMMLDMDGCRRRKQEWLACAGGGGTEERKGLAAAEAVWKHRVSRTERPQIVRCRRFSRCWGSIQRMQDLKLTWSIQERDLRRALIYRNISPVYSEDCPFSTYMPVQFLGSVMQVNGKSNETKVSVSLLCWSLRVPSRSVHFAALKIEIQQGTQTVTVPRPANDKKSNPLPPIPKSN